VLVLLQLGPCGEVRAYIMALWEGLTCHQLVGIPQEISLNLSVLGYFKSFERYFFSPQGKVCMPHVCIFSVLHKAVVQIWGLNVKVQGHWERKCKNRFFSRGLCQATVLIRVIGLVYFFRQYVFTAEAWNEWISTILCSCYALVQKYILIISHSWHENVAHTYL